MDGGATWTIQPVPDTSNSTQSNGGPVAISCSTNGACVTVGTNNNGDSVAWTLANGTWNEEPIPGAEAPNGDVQDISCVSNSECVAAGEDGSGNGSPAIWTSSNGISDWTEQIVPNSAGSNSFVRWVSCVSSTICVAVGEDSNGEDAWSLSGGSWIEQAIPNITVSNGSLSDISCGSASQCVAIGTDSSGAAAAWVGPA